MEKKTFSEDIQNLLDTKWKGKDIYSMSKDELIEFKKDVIQFRQEYNMLELSTKTLMNAAYGASANPFFYFFNPYLAADITGECRETTKFMNKKLENLFHEVLWERKDLQEKFGFKLDESKHDWYRTRHVWIYSDTDSSYTTYGDFFKCWLPECQSLIDTDLKKTEWILKFNVEFLDKQNFEWLNEIYVPRHAKNIHNFELETISKSGIYLKKKKYIKELVFNKGKFLIDHPKISGTGIEIIKSTTPKYCREVLTNLIKLLLHEYDNYSKEDFTIFFNNEVANYKKVFYQKCITDIDDISNSVGVGNYKKYVLNDTTELEFALKCPSSVKAMARFNYLAHKNGDDNLRMFSGKIKFYNIMEGSESTVFGYPMGERPLWSPKVDKKVQWQKNVLDPINRFLEVMEIPSITCDGVIQFDMFGNQFFDL